MRARNDVGRVAQEETSVGREAVAGGGGRKSGGGVGGGRLGVIREDEPVRVRAWRVEQFERLGFPANIAEILADADVDLGRARQLHAGGCDGETALQILL